MSSTRDLAREAAFKMLMSGTKPSVQKIREQLGKGSDKTILDGLNEFWSELGQLIQDWRTYPKIPDNLAKAMNEWWHMAMKQSHLSLEIERKEMKDLINNATSKMDSALLVKEQSVKSMEVLSQANDKLTEQISELEDKFHIQFNDNTRINSENTSLKKEQQKLNKQINNLEENHKEALKLSYERAQDTESNFAKQIDAWKIQADKSQVSLVNKEKEWKKINHENLKKIDKLYKELNDTEESNQKNIYQINNLTKTINDNKKALQHHSEQTKKIESSFNDLLIAKDRKIQDLLNEVSDLKGQIIKAESKENSLAESQEKLDQKFNQLLETIKSQG
jgi:chromosome segregation ATPase